MTESEVRAAIHEELTAHGFPRLRDRPGLDLISAGVNSVTLIQILSALEDRFDVDLETEPLFAEPATVERLAAEITRTARLTRPSG
ncbi:phosphopantetheine-binding protein [Streptomyces sp. NPDC102409]|uniref:phosphopantetheine-binding protein n=1 Tax=Streptomyces sp. NPDC102409 TaxID=3366172 RepID=UPI00381EF08F